ncbi:MAG: LexA family transcriptional regulator [Armatimonadota bacterium]
MSRQPRTKTKSPMRRFRESQDLTQQEMADRLGIKVERYKTYEYGSRKSIPDSVLLELRRMGFQADVGLPGAVTEEGEVRLTSVGRISAASKVDWTDPLASEEWEYVPSHMVKGRNRFCCRVESDCMMPFLQPDDICVWEATSVQRLGLVVLYRTNEMLLTIKQLRHDGERFTLNPLNPAYSTETAVGEVVGILVGVVRRVGRRVDSFYDPDGLRP